MMKKILFAFLLLISALAGSAYGQSRKLIFFSPSTNGTLFLLNETLTVSVNVTYVGSEEATTYPINTLAFNYTVNGVAGEPLPVQSPSLFLLNQKTTTVTLNIPISNLLFQEGGGHVIIIWPVTSVPADVLPGSFQLPEIIHVQAGASQIETPDGTPYPNPTTGTVNVNVPDKAELYLYDHRGQFVLKNSPNGTTKRSFDLSSLPPGNYTLIIRSNGKITRKTILKK